MSEVGGAVGHASEGGGLQPMVARRELIQAARISEPREDKLRVSPERF